MAKSPNNLKAAKSRKILSPFMLTLAAMTGWAAGHEPDVFTPGSLGVWLIGACTIALLTRAALALLSPLLGFMGIIFERAMRTSRDGAES
jgi:hypothetical protein